jgi:hypothetical protein
MRNDVIMRWASLLILSVLAVGYTGNAFAQAAHTPQLAFEVKLNGDQVLPEVFSNMTAEARFTFDEGMRFAKVFMKVRNNFFGVTGVSLYLGEAGKNGEEVAVIEVLDPEVMTRTFTIAEVINSTEVVKVDSVTNIASLYQAVRDGRVYCISGREQEARATRETTESVVSGVSLFSPNEEAPAGSSAGASLLPLE